MQAEAEWPRGMPMRGTGPESDLQPEFCERASSWWVRARWSDGRLVSPLDVGIPRLVRLVATLLAMCGVWLNGHAGLPVSLMVPYPIFTAALLVVAGAWCLAGSNCRRCRLADKAPSSLVASGRTLSPFGWWRAPRWPDGRHIADDRLANALAVLGSVLLLAAVWMLGRSGIPPTGIDTRWAPLSALLVLPACLTAVVTSARAISLPTPPELPATSGGQEPDRRSTESQRS